jgi:hypothetical protein
LRQSNIGDSFRRVELVRSPSDISTSSSPGRLVSDLFEDVGDSVDHYLSKFLDPKIERGSSKRKSKNQRCIDNERNHHSVLKGNLTTTGNNPTMRHAYEDDDITLSKFIDVANALYDDNESKYNEKKEYINDAEPLLMVNKPVKPKKRPLVKLLTKARLRLTRNRKLTFEESDCPKRVALSGIQKEDSMRVRTLKGRKLKTWHRKETSLTPQSHNTSQTISVSDGSLSPSNISSPSIATKPTYKRSNKTANIPILLPRPKSYSVANKGRMRKPMRNMTTAKSRYVVDSDSSSDGSEYETEEEEEGTLTGILVSFLESLPCGSPLYNRNYKNDT